MTTTTDQKNTPQERTYGNWQKRPPGGLFGLGTAGTIAGFTGVILIMIVFMIAGPVAGMVFAAVFAALMSLLLVRGSHGRSLLQRMNASSQFRYANKTGSNLLRQGPLTPRADYRLPGILAKTTVTEHHDGLGREFALISYRAGYHCVVIECRPDGTTNVDSQEIDMAVALWGEWLSKHATILGLVAASVTIETAPDSGNQLKHEIDLAMSDNAPELARTVMQQIKDSYPAGSAVINAWITLSFAETGRIEKARKFADRITEMGTSIGTELPDLVHTLGGTGAGAAHPMDVQTLCEVVRTAYDPDCGPIIEQAKTEGVRRDALSWEQAGPASTQAAWDHYQHDSGVTITSVMTMPPRSAVPSEILSRLMAPQTNSKVMRKRVTLHYRPLPMEQASKEVEKDLSAAIFTKNAATKATAHHHKAIEAAQATAMEEARGAGMDDFALVISTTVRSIDDLPAARVMGSTLSANARLRVRPAYGWQDAAFALALPVGLDPRRHVKTPEFVKKVAR